MARAREAAEELLQHSGSCRRICTAERRAVIGENLKAATWVSGVSTAST
ncbi:hypothetical protein [Embleya sp. NPDC005575]